MGRVIDPATVARAEELIAAGQAVKDVAAATGLSRTTVYKLKADPADPADPSLSMPSGVAGDLPSPTPKAPALGHPPPDTSSPPVGLPTAAVGPAAVADEEKADARELIRTIREAKKEALLDLAELEGVPRTDPILVRSLTPSKALGVLGDRSATAIALGLRKVPWWAWLVAWIGLETVGGLRSLILIKRLSATRRPLRPPLKAPESSPSASLPPLKVPELAPAE